MAEDPQGFEPPKGYARTFPEGTLRITTGCQYCAVGCGYNAFLVPGDATDPVEPAMDGVSRFITSAMTNSVNFKGKKHRAAVAPDVRCDLNKGNHSVRGGSQGGNLVTHDGTGRSTQDRLKSPQVRLADGRLHEISWVQVNEVMARLLVRATQMKPDGTGQRIRVKRPEALGVKIYEYQYLENTYAATKLFYSAIGTPNVAYHDRPSTAGSSPGLEDVGFRPHDFSYDDVRQSDVLVFIGANPYENQSVFFMQYCQGKQMIVIDPRKTATAQYAVQTGGVHLQTTRLGADSLLLYAMAREILRSWSDFAHGRQRKDFPLREGVGTNVNMLPVRDCSAKDQYAKRRRASRALSFDAFATEFLETEHDNDDGAKTKTYSLDYAAEQAGLDKDDIARAVALLFDPSKTTLAEQPKVAILYEKGMIWGFNYHNTAAVGSLGLLLGAYSEPGRLVGRLGGHQKGWAEARTAVDVFAKSTDEGYPFRNVRDQYADQWLVKLWKRRPDKIKDETIGVHHNLDNHVFGVDKNFIDRRLGRGKVRLKNGLITKTNPDVRLLWIIGGNYCGQTNDGQRKQQELLKRLRKGGANGRILRPAARPKDADISIDEIVDALGTRIDARGIVLVHQEIIANPTTDLCDIVIPAAGWGEDTFCRYNAQRRLKLYDRFQDMPLHEKDTTDESGNPIEGDPMDRIDDFQHSPKPDWMIIRDIAAEVGRLLDGGHKGNLYADIAAAFSWRNSSELADEMACNSNRQEMLGDLVAFGKQRGVPESEGRLHRVLGKKIVDDQHPNEAHDATAPHLGKDQQTGEYLYTIQGQSDVYGNGIASNGVLLPVRGVTDSQGRIVRLEGTLSVQRNGPFYFVRAPWDEIRAFHSELQPGDGELFITNGRFNHLWNNMFHHLRNEYVNERYPEDLPGTILEVNHTWANAQGMENGQVVDVTSGKSSFRAIASLQDSVPPEGAFAMFSYPVRENTNGKRHYNFDGYVNNITNGYADGINPIGALKYGHGIVTKVPNPQTGDANWVFPRDFPNRSPRLGPTFEQRNVITKAQASNPLDWEMRERIVRLGLPRAFVHTADPQRRFRFLDPDEFFRRLLENVKGDRNKFASYLESMRYPAGGQPILVDRWSTIEKVAARIWLASVSSNNGNSPGSDRFSRVKKILDDSVGGPTAPVGWHGSFWRELERDQFVAYQVVGFNEQLPLVSLNDDGTGNGADSNLVKALKGETPFGKDLTPPPAAAKYPRMPKDRAPVDGDDIQFIQDWIDDGCPDDSTPTPNGGNPTMARQTSFKDHIVHMFRPIDVARMTGIISLEDYDAVKAKADEIIDRISRGENDVRLMPPKANGGPWPQEWIDLFKRWKGEDFPQ